MMSRCRSLSMERFWTNPTLPADRRAQNGLFVSSIVRPEVGMGPGMMIEDVVLFGASGIFFGGSLPFGAGIASPLGATGAAGAAGLAASAPASQSVVTNRKAAFTIVPPLGD